MGFVSFTNFPALNACNMKGQFRSRGTVAFLKFRNPKSKSETEDPDLAFRIREIGLDKTLLVRRILVNGKASRPTPKKVEEFS
jgi:hypothetical protein